jgi:3-hydroxyacyl-[acyl-carrier-protein] dehydratase
VLLAGEMTEGASPVYTGLDKVRVKAPVRPGDTVETECRVTRAKPPF